MKHDRMKLIFIGEGEARSELEEKARSVPGVEFTGSMPHDEVLKRCAEARAVVSPSVCWETFGLASVEAQSVGTPSLVSDLGGLPDSVENGRTGFVFHHDDAVSCSSAIRRALNMNEAAFDQMASLAKGRSEKVYSEESNYRQLQAIYGNARRVLLVHNYYGSSAPSGENKVFDAERTMLARHDVMVEAFTRESDEIRGQGIWGAVKGALSTVGNPFSARSLAKRIVNFKPDVIHFHNTFPLISPLAVRAAHQSGCRVVVTLHNYRPFCAAGVPLRDGRVCSLCLDKRCARDALRYRCYRGSLLATIPLVMNIALYRNHLQKWADKFIVLSDFQRKELMSCGWPQEKIVIKGNFTEPYDCAIVPAVARRDEVLYVGRLSREKGVFVLLEAWKRLMQEEGLMQGV